MIPGTHTHADDTVVLQHGSTVAGGTMAVVSMDGTANCTASHQADAAFPIHVLISTVDEDAILSMVLDIPAAELLLESITAALHQGA